MNNNDEILIRTALASNFPVIVIFNKEDGTIRVMKCTWNLNLIPADKHPHEQEPRKDLAPPSTYARIFDLEKNEWRSFRWDSVISYKWDKETLIQLKNDISEL